MLAALGLGLALQRTRGVARLRAATWTGYFWTLAPLLVFTTFLTMRFDAALAGAVCAAVLATWLLAGAAWAYARAVGRTREERGALLLAGAWANSGFVGMPLAQLAFGHPGLALAVVYDRLAWLVPASSISVTVARLHGRAVAVVRERRLRALLLNPPLWAAAAALALRAAGAGVPASGPLGSVAAAAVGPAGFLLLGLAVPLEPVAHESAELRRAAGAILLRFAGGPLTLLLVAHVLGVRVPAPFYLLAGMPTAFHVLVLARVYDVRPALMRLIVVGSTVVAVAAVAVGSALAR
jgi:predicted permease